MRYAKTREDFDASIIKFDEFCAHQLVKIQNYIHKYWLCPEWRETFSGGRTMLYNTNNYSEAIFRVAVSVIFDRKSCKTVAYYDNQVPAPTSQTCIGF
jgi:hypothetical protein